MTKKVKAYLHHCLHHHQHLHHSVSAAKNTIIYDHCLRRRRLCNRQVRRNPSSSTEAPSPSRFSSQPRSSSSLAKQRGEPFDFSEQTKSKGTGSSNPFCFFFPTRKLSQGQELGFTCPLHVPDPTQVGPGYKSRSVCVSFELFKEVAQPKNHQWYPFHNSLTSSVTST